MPPPPLDQIYFYLTEGCNLACRHCWLSPVFEKSGVKSPTLKIEHFKIAIDDAKPLGLKGVKLTGGEPLLHPHFKELLEAVRNENLRLTVETNGMLCTPEIAAEIAKSEDNFVSVSIDGADQETHDSIRGVPGSFEKATNAIKNLVAAGIHPQVIMSIMSCNVGQLNDIVTLSEFLGAGSVKFNIVQPTGRGEKIRTGIQGVEITKLIDHARYVETELQSKTKIPLIFDIPIAFRSLKRVFSTNGSNVCGILGIIGVIPNGHYALCGIGTHTSALVFGRIEKGALKNIWHQNSIIKNLREGLPEKLKGICQRCLMKHRCLGSCLAQNFYRTGTIWGPYWFCEQADNLSLFPDTRLNRN